MCEIVSLIVALLGTKQRNIRNVCTFHYGRGSASVVMKESGHARTVERLAADRPGDVALHSSGLANGQKFHHVDAGACFLEISTGVLKA